MVGVYNLSDNNSSAESEILSTFYGTRSVPTPANGKIKVKKNSDIIKITSKSGIDFFKSIVIDLKNGSAEVDNNVLEICEDSSPSTDTNIEEWFYWMSGKESMLNIQKFKDGTVIIEYLYAKPPFIDDMRATEGGFGSIKFR